LSCIRIIGSCAIAFAGLGKAPDEQKGFLYWWFMDRRREGPPTGSGDPEFSHPDFKLESSWPVTATLPGLPCGCRSPRVSTLDARVSPGTPTHGHAEPFPPGCWLFKLSSQRTAATPLVLHSPALSARRTMRPVSDRTGDFDDYDDDVDEPLLTNGGQSHPRPKNVFALERTYLTWTHMAVTVRPDVFLTAESSLHQNDSYH